ncbi:hypothetical protein Hanom_Chr09g00863271 [Helianthus anomalus]
MTMSYGCRVCHYYIDVNCVFMPEEITHANHLLTRVDGASSSSVSKMECHACRVSIALPHVSPERRFVNYIYEEKKGMVWYDKAAWTSNKLRVLSKSNDETVIGTMISTSFCGVKGLFSGISKSTCGYAMSHAQSANVPVSSQVRYMHQNLQNHPLQHLYIHPCQARPALGVDGEDHRPGPDILRGTFLMKKIRYVYVKYFFNRVHPYKHQHRPPYKTILMV